MMLVRKWPALLLTVLLAAGIGAAPANAKVPPALSQQGHGTFWECGSKTTALLVAVNRLTLHPGQALNMNFLAKNNGDQACNYVAPYAGSTTGTTAAALQIGPCGSMGFEVEATHHRNVWPGTLPFNCPALGFAQLQSEGVVTGSGSWNQMSAANAKRVSPGNYTLVLDGRYKFPLRIAAH
jgi:hypothetical protein